MRKVIAFVGNYGSGKTELSLNTAYTWNQQGRKVTLIDLDIVNPYFRSSERTTELQQAGIEVIAPVFANTNVDVPYLPPQVGGSFANLDRDLILDVGGDPVGAKALGQFRHQFREQDGKLYFVINVFRPLTSDVPSILKMLENIQGSCSMQVDALINNSNLSHETTAEHVRLGLSMVEEVSRQTGLPILYSSGMKQALEGIPEPTFVLKRQMELPV